jgi:UDP-glucuronate decarboxylase
MHPNDGRVVSNFLVQALLGRDITIYGAGQQTRSFCYVDDLVDGLIRMMATPSAVTGPINMGSSVEFTIHELAREVIRLTHSCSKIISKPLPLDDPRQRQPDLALAREQLGWSPRTSLEQGLVQTISHFKQLLNNDDVRLQLAPD